MEQQPKQASFNIDNFGEVLNCTPDNTIAYIYENEEQDHIFYIKGEDENSAFGYHIFRGNMPDSFDRMVDYMRANGYDVYENTEFTDSDKEALVKYKTLITIREYEARQLTQRQKNKVKFLRYLLKKELLIDEDFQGKGELFI